MPHNIFRLQLGELYVQPRFSAEVKNMCSYVASPPYVFMAWCLNQQKPAFSVYTLLYFRSLLHLFIYIIFLSPLDKHFFLSKLLSLKLCIGWLVNIFLWAVLLKQRQLGINICIVVC
jgi:hypothetical protein